MEDVIQDRPHEENLDCWCGPEIIFEADNGNQVIVHKGPGEELAPPWVIVQAIANAMSNYEEEINMEGLIEGRIVHYVLTESDVKLIKESRAKADQIPWNAKLPGVLYAGGNTVEAGQHVPMVIVKVWNKERGYVNGKVFLDGHDEYWVTSRSFDEEKIPGSWHWIEPA